MQFNTPRNLRYKSSSAKKFLLKRLDKASEELNYHQLLQHLVTVVSKESSNNVALVVIAAMFFGFLVLALRPIQPHIDPTYINLQNNPTTIIITEQQQTQSQNHSLPESQQMIEEDSPLGS